MIQILDKLGADPKILAMMGQSIYHLSVENDQIIPLYYFKDRLSLDIQNASKQTPLIYSVDLSSDTSSYFLISLGSDVDVQDINGYTALHWAA